MHGPISHQDALGALVVPAHQPTLQAAQQALARGDASTALLAEILGRDPVIALEICRAAYSTGLARGDTGSGPVLGEMIGRLGLKYVSELLLEISQRDAGLSPESKELLERYREQCCRLADIARKIGSILSPPDADACYTLGLFALFGDLLAVIHLRGTFIDLVRDNLVRSKLIYKLTRDFDFDPEFAAIKHLRLHGMPEKMLGCLDREAQVTGEDSVFRKMVVLSALELKSAAEEQKLANYAPEKALPARSYLRMLQVNEQQHRKIYQEINDLFLSYSEESPAPKESIPRFGDNPLPEVAETPARTPAAAPRPILAVSGTMPSAARIKRIEKLRKKASEIAAARQELSNTATAGGSPEHQKCCSYVEFLVPATPLIVQAIRGIRNAESIYGTAQLEAFRKATLSITKTIVENSGRYAAPIFFAARAFYPAQCPPDTKISIDKATTALTPREVATIIAVTYLFHEIRPRCNEDEWRVLFQKMSYEIALGQLLGRLITPIGPGYGQLLPAFRYLSMALFLIADPVKFKEYRTHLVTTQRLTDPAKELELFGISHRVLMARLLQELGFGVKMAQAICSDNTSRPPAEDIDQIALVDRWICATHQHGNPFTDDTVYDLVSPRREEVVALRERIRQLSHHLACPWIGKLRNDITYDPNKQFIW